MGKKGSRAKSPSRKKAQKSQKVKTTFNKIKGFRVERFD